ncbi:IclR family transcriptional regulator [Spirillospora sp. CA-108201]
MAGKNAGGSPQAGSQTLARGLTALMTIVETPDGMSVQDLADHLGVHRTIAYRLLQTLMSFGLVAHGSDGLYRAGARLATLADAYLPALREASLPIMKEVANEIGCTVSLFVAERSEAVSIVLVEPTTVSWHLRFKVGMRTPIDRGAAGYALLAAGEKVPGEPTAVSRARQRGYATSHGEVERGAYAVAAAIPQAQPRACLNLITYREDQAKAAEKHIRAAAERLGEVLHLAHSVDGAGTP